MSAPEMMARLRTGAGPDGSVSGRVGEIAALHHLLRAFGVRPDVELEDGGRDVQRYAGVRDVNDAAHPAFDRRRADDRISLLARVAEVLQIIDGVKAGLPIGDGNVEIMLIAVVVHRKPLEDEELGIAR